MVKARKGRSGSRPDAPSGRRPVYEDLSFHAQQAAEKAIKAVYVKLASLYRNLDTLHPKRALIESRLADRERTLFNLDQTIFLYDLTSTYFDWSFPNGGGLHLQRVENTNEILRVSVVTLVRFRLI